MKTYTYYIEFKKRCAETVTIEAPSEEEARKSLNETFQKSHSGRAYFGGIK